MTTVMLTEKGREEVDADNVEQLWKFEQALADAQAAVDAQKEDMPYDSVDHAFDYGFGLTWSLK